MLLCIDIGNTNITLGLYEGKTLGPRWRLATIHNRMPDEFGIQLIGLLQHAKIEPKLVECALIASVVPPLTNKWVQVCQMYLGCTPMVIDSNTKSLCDGLNGIGVEAAASIDSLMSAGELLWPTPSLHRLAIVAVLVADLSEP